MSEEKSGMTKGLIIGFLAGGVIGTILGLLYAPKSGKELRSDLRKKATDLAEDAGDILRTAKAKSADLINQGKSKSEQLVSEAREKAGHIMNDAEKMLSGIRERSSAEGSKVKAAFRAGMDAYHNEKNKDA